MSKVKDKVAWSIAYKIHDAKKELIELQSELEGMGYTLHFNKNNAGYYEPVLYKKFTNCIRKVSK